jgi:CubicO group peptidase (beta-lactamase class C family)
MTCMIDAVPQKPIERLLVEMTARRDPGGYLNGGYATIAPDGQTQAFVTGRVAPAGPRFTDVTTRLRMASISKAATARAACALVLRGALPLDVDVTSIVRWPDPLEWLREYPVTVRHLLSHLSGLTDHAGYLPDHGQSIMAFITDHPEAVSGRLPGSYFTYANINYVLLGHVMEAATATRFDHILWDEVLRPAGIAGGFNWAGVSFAERANRLALYQRWSTGLRVEADADDADWQADLIWRGGRGHDFASYRLARDTSLLSPHAGLRMNIVEAARLARYLGSVSPAEGLQRQIAWQYDPVAQNGEDCDGLFTRFGLGLTIYRDHPRIPSHLIGHAGHALGFTGGVWYNPDTSTAHAYFLTGSRDETEGQDSEAFYGPTELSIMQQL